MKTYFFFLIALITISCQKNIQSNPDNYLSKGEINAFKFRIVRYFEGLPKNASHAKKWDTTHNDYYYKKAEVAELTHYYKNEDGYIYFAITKIAPSLNRKKVASIGKLKIEKDTIVYYEEICRTWKMEPPELKKKTKILFDKIVNNKDVFQYYTKNSEPEFWIEFPDDQTNYNIKLREWQTKK